VNDPFDLDRFVAAQRDVYPQALAELRAGRKRSHWMWFVFPQVEGLGASPVSRRYAIRDLDEARAYFNHPELGPRLVECARTLLERDGLAASEIFPYPDDLKLKSSMTLFECAAPAPSVFTGVLERYFDGERDGRTLQRLALVRFPSSTGDRRGGGA
jgi:uncharacterized protein (DUF1810 family)